MKIVTRETFLLKLNNPEGVEAVKTVFDELPEGIDTLLRKRGVGNFSLWTVDSLVFGYFETARDIAWTEKEAAALLQYFTLRLAPLCEIVGDPIDHPMRLMYKSLGVIREDKSLVRHRVFATKLKPGCAEEYKRRHDALGGDKNEGKEGEDSNFTIWNADRYIFGYCEKVLKYAHEMTEEEKQGSIAWETRGLEIMDWITDDVDWITGEHHSKIRRLL